MAGSETAHTVADRVSRNQCVTAATLNTMLNASSVTIAPYAASNASITVSEVSTDANGNATVTLESHVTQGLYGKSPRHRRRAQAITFHLMGISLPLIARECCCGSTPVVVESIFRGMPLLGTLQRNFWLRCGA
jgi:hypothetical protein